MSREFIKQMARRDSLLCGTSNDQRLEELHERGSDDGEPEDSDHGALPGVAIEEDDSEKEELVGPEAEDDDEGNGEDREDGLYED
jgi:hypothetical protein